VSVSDRACRVSKRSLRAYTKRWDHRAAHAAMVGSRAYQKVTRAYPSASVCAWGGIWLSRKSPPGAPVMPTRRFWFTAAAVAFMVATRPLSTSR
jgi:hypothetical protein